MQLNLVSFEQATALKNLGFPALSADWSYRNDGELYNFVDDDGYVTAAPTLELAAKWLREEKLIHIFITHLNADTNWWEYNIETINGDFIDNGKMYKSYKDTAGTVDTSKPVLVEFSDSLVKQENTTSLALC